MTIALPRVARSDVLLVLAATGVVASIAFAALATRPESLDDRARAIEAELRCPTCQGLSIADSPATSARQMRTIVDEQLAAGATDDEVRAFFVARYGRWILLKPSVSGPDLVLWVAPAGILAVGTLLVVRRARTQVTRSRTRPATAGLPLPASRFGTVAIAIAMALAVAVPIVAAVGPRLAGQQVSGGGVSGAAPSIEELEASVRAQPNDIGVLIALGDALLAADRAAEAADQYKAVLSLDPDNISALLGVGGILLAADRPDAAAPVFDRVLALSPDQPDALFLRAVARVRLDGTATDQVRRDVARFLAVASPSDTRRAMASALLSASPSPFLASPPPATVPRTP